MEPRSYHECENQSGASSLPVQNPWLYDVLFLRRSDGAKRMSSQNEVMESWSDVKVVNGQLYRYTHAYISHTTNVGLSTGMWVKAGAAQAPGPSVST